MSLFLSSDDLKATDAFGTFLSRKIAPGYYASTITGYSLIKSKVSNATAADFTVKLIGGPEVKYSIWKTNKAGQDISSFKSGVVSLLKKSGYTNDEIMSFKLPAVDGQNAGWDDLIGRQVSLVVEIVDNPVGDKVYHKVKDIHHPSAQGLPTLSSFTSEDAAEVEDPQSQPPIVLRRKKTLSPVESK
jgi:hypothetical protein